MRFLYDEQIASQPQAVQEVLADPLPPGLLDPGRPLVFAGLGSSLHAARIAAWWVAELTGGRSRPAALDAHELHFRGPLQAGEQLVVVSHRGARGLTGRLLARAREAGVRTILVAARGAPSAADALVETCPPETAETHSVSFTTALVRLGQLATLVCSNGAHLSAALREVPSLLGQALALPAPIEAAQKLLGRGPLVLGGFGLDALLAEEAALKLKEAACVWATGTSTELLLHGPVAALSGLMGAITFTPMGDDGGRTTALRSILGTLGVAELRCGPGEELPFPSGDELVRPLAGAIAVQRLAAELARLLGTNPDLPRALVPQ